MWMVDGNDHSQKLKMPTDTVYGRKLRPLMPRPISSCSTKNSPFSTISTPSCCCIRSPSILPWNHDISGVSDYGVKREIQTVPLVSTRWNPTPEQLQALEEMYRRGIRTPSAEQIQQIAAKLRRFGKIEGKNVFYWFQNHKARERQKKRRQLELLAGKKIHHAETSDTKQTGLSRRCFEIEHHKKLPALSNCSTPSEDSASMHGAVVAPERRKDGWTQLHEKELQQHRILTAKNETRWQLDLSSCLSPSNSSINTLITAAQKATGQDITDPSSSLNLSILLSPKINDDNLDENYEMKENQTLQLFPIGNIGFSTLNATHEEDQIIHDASSIGAKVTPNEFIEFLPIKN